MGVGRHLRHLHQPERTVEPMIRAVEVIGCVWGVSLVGLAWALCSAAAAGDSWDDFALWNAEVEAFIRDESDRVWWDA